MVDGFPELTDSFLAGQDVFYVQFNDVSFYVEDTEQEHLYFNILKRLFVNVQFDKIFPLNGKNNLKNHARDNSQDNTKVYIADSDFEDILGTKEELENVFYLNKYSIENFLVEKEGIFEIIREKKPKLKNDEIEDLIDLNSNLKQCKLILSDLTCTFIVIQKYELGKEYFGLSPARDFNLESTPPAVRNNFLPNYFNEVEQLLQEKDGRYTLKSKQREFKSHFKLLTNALKNIPGKYLINVIKHQLEKAGLINQISIESLTYKLSKECNLDSLHYLRSEIHAYRQ
ncbi:hypothetical protein A7A78_08850 [Aequorivita soesokkakensis]|uniref:DUF4435 domain-containing protein n=1 Tax=Aequorivita soesokkakensis TaxID=1385699 RepID=A0A1A9LGL1_9FLAO|nr:DUF4435 domain-containing protein [Aequorivita soesokkakensis]OAD92333.1 hypothetical protein A7A78_08850 [Aequorivita soesokkakensis]